MSAVSRELFEGLKERAVNCVNDPNWETIESFRQFIAKCDNNFVNSLYQYSIFPLRHIIANLHQIPTNLERTLISTVECLTLIFEKSRINRFDIFADLFTNLFHLIDDNRYLISDKDSDFKATEDLISSVIKCAKALIQSGDNSLVPDLVSREFSPQIGHAIHTLLSVANNQKYSCLRVEAIDAIHCLIDKCKLISSKDKSECTPQDLIAYFLPGISIQISKLITSDDKLNRKVIDSALKLLGNTIVFVFEDISFETSENCDKKIAKESDPEDNPVFYVVRNKTWFEATTDKLLIIFDKIILCLICHQNSDVRQTLATFVIHMLTNCSSLSTKKCLSLLLRVPLTYLSDDCESLRFKCDSFVAKFSATNVSCDSSKSYLDIIEDQIYSYITSLPRLIRNGSDREKVTSIYLLYGHLKCLDTNGINYLIYSLQHKQQLFDCLIDICAFDDHGIRLLEQVSNAEAITDIDDRHSPHKWISKSFKHLTEEKCVKAVTDCCQLIASRVEPQILIDYLTDLLTQSKFNPSVLFVSNQLVSNIQIDFNQIEELLELYIRNINTIIDDKTIEQMNKDILRQCLLVEGLTAFLHLYDTNSSHKYLMISIFPLLESLGASNQSIFETSYRALTLVSQHFSYNSLSLLISDNMDYLINWICINLKHFTDNQRVPIVIKAMLKHSSEDILHLFVDAINQIIVVLDSYYSTQSLPLMQVLSAFVSTLNHYYLKREETSGNCVTIDSQRRDTFVNRSQHLIESLQEFFKNKRITEDLEADNESVNGSKEDLDCPEEEQKTELPFYVTITEKILDRCIHLMSDNESKVRLIVLDIVIEGLLLLKPFEDHLLPMAHQLWSPLVNRFADKDIIVIKRSFACLQIMSKTCGDFIRDRTLKEVFPKILSFLRSQSKISYKKDRASAYRFTVGYQFQMEILRGIGSIAVDLDLRDKELWQLIVEVMPYLSTYQPIPLQESAIIALKTISQVDSCSLFYYLKRTHTEDKTVYHSETNAFHRLTFDRNDKEFAKNVTKVLEYLTKD